MIGQPGVALTVKSIERPLGKLSENGFELEELEGGGLAVLRTPDDGRIGTDGAGTDGAG